MHDVQRKLHVVGAGTIHPQHDNAAAAVSDRDGLREPGRRLAFPLA